VIRQLRFGRVPAASGRAKSLVVFVHGYGADGADLLGLAQPLAPHLPDTVFLAPDAPERSVANPFGYQWFPIPWLDGSAAEAAQAGLLAAARDLDAFLDARLEEEGLSPSALALVGFSQGAMMSLHVAPRRPAPVAAVVGFSGRLLGPERLAAETVSRPPVLLVHGDADQVVPPEALPEAAEALAGAGFEVQTHVSRGTGHGIAPDGLTAALRFLTARLPA
jgi:phospholipase/carboxylesterase